MLTKSQLQIHREEIVRLAEKYGASNLRLFGSIARGDANTQSDIDIVARFEAGRSLLDQGGLLMDLRRLLGVEVDLISEGALTGRFGQIVRDQAVPL